MKQVKRSVPRIGVYDFERLERRLLLAGDTCTEGMAAFDIESIVSTDQFHALDAGSTMSTAYDLGQITGSRSIPGRVGENDTRDLIKFSLARPSSVALALTGLSADVDMYLYNASGRTVANSSNGGSRAENINTTLGTGTYYVSISPWLTYQSSSYQFSYSTSLSSSPAPPRPTPTPIPTTPAPTPIAANPAPPATQTPAPLTPADGTISAFPGVAYYGGSNEWNVNAINAPEAWAQGYTGQGVTVAVVDTGVDLDHADLVSNIWVNPGEIPGNGFDDDRNGFIDDVNGWDFAANDARPDDINGHGTHVAGSIAADQNGVGATGVAHDATIMPVRVLGNDGSGSSGDVAAGIRYAAANGADIINLSLGGGYSSSILSAIQYAGRLGSIVVAAAGNESAPVPSYPARSSANLTSLISVGAYTLSDRIASFSNDVGNSGAVQVDAPGQRVYSTYVGGRYARLSGTSMAAPHVAGLAALTLSANADLTSAQLRALIVEGANDTISGSDAIGGVNAAVTVALAEAGRTGSATIASSPSAIATASRSSARIRRSNVDAAFAAGVFSPNRQLAEVESMIDGEINEVALDTESGEERLRPELLSVSPRRPIEAALMFTSTDSIESSFDDETAADWLALA